MFKYIKQKAAANIDTLNWMDDQTKKIAKTKVNLN